MSPIVRRILNLMDASGALLEPGSIEALVQEYTDAVFEVNERLEQSADLVRRGLRSEAIAAAAGPPSVIDQAIELDFDRFDEFCELIGFYDLPLPLRIDHESIALINDAMVEIQPIEKLLRRQRQLALARAPLAWRLRTLRAISDADPMTMHWQDDIAAWEKARLSQLEAEVPAAIAAGDPQKLGELHRELTDPGWQTDVPAKLIGLISGHQKSQRIAELTAQLASAADRLVDASQQFDEDAGHAAAASYRDQTAKLAKVAGGAAIPATIAAKAAGPMQWVEELEVEAQRQSQRAAALGQFDSVLHRRGDGQLSQIEDAYQRVAAYDEPIPPELFSRYNVLVDELRTGASRRFALMIAGVAAATLLVVGSLAWLQIQRSHNGRVAAVSEQLAALLDAGQLDQAGAFIDAVGKQQPAVAAESLVTELVARHADMTTRERQRADRFATDLLVVRETEDSQLQSGDITRLGEAATTDEEQIAAHQQQMRYETFLADRIKDQTKRLAAALVPHRERVQGLVAANAEVADPDELQSMVGQIDQMTDQLTELRRQFAAADSAMLAEAETLARRAGSLRKQLAAGMAQSLLAQTQQQQVLAARSPRELREKLLAYTQALPDHIRSDDYRRVLDSAELWDTADVWNEHLQAIKTLVINLADDASRKRLTESTEALRQQVAIAPAELPPSVKELIEMLPKRTELLTQTTGGFNDSLFGQLISVTEDDGMGKRYFVYQTYYDRNRDDFVFGANESAKTKFHDVLTAADGSVAKTKLRGDFKIETEPKATLDLLRLSMSNRPGEFIVDWDRRMLMLLADIRGRTELDSNIRQMLTYDLLKTTIAGSRVVAATLQPVVTTMQGSLPDWRSWYAPGERQVRISPTMTGVVYPALSRAYAARRPLVTSELDQFRVAAVGVAVAPPIDAANVSRRPAEAVRLWKPAAQMPAGDLMVVSRDSNQPKMAAWTVIGTLAGGHYQPTAQAPAPIPGQLVFLKRSEKPSTTARLSNPTPLR